MAPTDPRVARVRPAGVRPAPVQPAGGRRRLIRTIALAALVAAAPGRALAQRAGAEIRLPEQTSLAVEGPLVRVVRVLDDRELRDLLGHGFPVRVHYKTELWTVGRFFNDLEATREWDVVVRLDPLMKVYEVARIVGDQVAFLGRFDDLDGASAAAERPFRAPLTPPRGKRAYYNVVIDVETLSLSDLDEVERWLRGELRPAVRGRRSPGTALGNGLKVLAERVLGGETRHFEVRSETFRP
ncbi:hypothetical protein tb265_32160 [Gemmatimonadetes bacterium T265]|nr:hypothetical protein tb265_32160 [Gemmatimonadetes bacterium T265]